MPLTPSETREVLAEIGHRPKKQLGQNFLVDGNIVKKSLLLLHISLFRFYFISQLGMLPATVIYVNAGSEISKVNSINDIMSFTLIVSFILVAILPILIKFLMNYYTKLNNI